MSASYARNHDCICILHSVCNTCTGLSPCVQARCPLQRVTQSNPSTSSDITPPRQCTNRPACPFGATAVTPPDGGATGCCATWSLGRTYGEMAPRVHVVLSGTYADIVDYVESNDHGKVMVSPVCMLPGRQSVEELAHTGHVLWVFDQAGLTLKSLIKVSVHSFGAQEQG